MTPLDYYLWGAVKDKCYADKPETIDALKDNICEAVGEIQLHTKLKLHSKLHSMFHSLFLKIALSAAELTYFRHLGAGI